MSREKILVVDDDRTTAKIIELQLAKMGYDVVSTAKNGPEAIDKTRTLSPDLLLMDIKLGRDMDGIEAAKIIMQEYQVPVIYLTAHSDDATLNRALDTQPLGYVNKPLRETDLRTTISLALTRMNSLGKTKELPRIENPQSWQIQLTCNLEGKITRVHYGSKKTLNKLGIDNTQQLLPASHHQHISECIKTKKPLMVFEKKNGDMLSLEYIPIADSNIVNLIISEKAYKNTLNEKDSLQHANLLDTLDHLSTGIILFNENLNIFYKNNSAQKILESGTGLKDNDGFLNAYDPEITAELKWMAAEQKDHLLSIERGEDPRALNILVTSLKSYKKNFGRNLPTTILFAFETTDDYQRVEEVLRSLYNLSPSEAKLVSQLFITPHLATAAESLGITLNTARTHLKRIYNKTNVHRISSLIHMIVTGPASVIFQTDK